MQPPDHDDTDPAAVYSSGCPGRRVNGRLWLNALGTLELHRQRVAEEQRNIGVESRRNTSVEVATQRVLLDCLDHAGTKIRQRTQL